MLVQLLAFASWGGVVLAIAPGRVSMRTWPLQAALLIIAAIALWSCGPGSLPSSYTLVSLAMLAAAMLVAWAVGEAARQDSAVSVFAAVAWGILLAGLINATVAFVQVFAPSLTHGGPIEQSHLIGRAVGNMRQPTHLCSLLLWGVVAAVALHELRQLRLKWAVAAVTLMIVAVELSASRTGAIGLSPCRRESRAAPTSS